MECLRPRIKFPGNMVELFEMREMNEEVPIKRSRHIDSSLLFLELTQIPSPPPKNLLSEKE